MTATNFSSLFSMMLCLGSIIVAADASQQQQVHLRTTAANFDLSISFDKGKQFSINELFRFESLTSKLFHTELSNANGSSTSDHGTPDVIATSVQVTHMNNENHDTLGLTLKSVVSVIYSDVGLINALQVASPYGSGIETTPDVASLLKERVTAVEILNVLTADGLVIDDTFVLELTFADFDGSSDEMGISVTETNIITNDASWSPSWRPFFGGLIDTLGIIIIALFGFGIVASLLSCGLGKDTIFSSKKGDDDNRSVHYKYDVNDLNLNVVTSPNGILGGKGHFPRSRLDEISHPNSYWDSPKSMTSDVHSPPSKQPMGIEKMETVSLT